MNIDLGTVKKGGETSQEVTFPKKVIATKVGCPSCTRASIINDNTIRITYKAVDAKGTWNKSVTITFEDNTTEKITYKIKVN